MRLVRVKNILMRPSYNTKAYKTSKIIKFLHFFFIVKETEKKKEEIENKKGVTVNQNIVTSSKKFKKKKKRSYPIFTRVSTIIPIVNPQVILWTLWLLLFNKKKKTIVNCIALRDPLLFLLRRFKHTLLTTRPVCHTFNNNNKALIRIDLWDPQENWSLLFGHKEKCVKGERKKNSYNLHNN